MRGRVLVLGLGIALLVAAGCESKVKYAPVSGRVTLDGKPLAGAYVYFQPVAPEGSNTAAAPGSAGHTDTNGEYTLKGTDGQDGAWVGKHKVMIEAHTADPESDLRPGRGGPPQKNKVPPKYNRDSNEFFDVPADGTNGANFDLKSK